MQNDLYSIAQKKTHTHKFYLGILGLSKNIFEMFSFHTETHTRK